MEGYLSDDKKKFISDEDAFLYALFEIAGGGESIKNEFVEWFYSARYRRVKMGRGGENFERLL